MKIITNIVALTLAFIAGFATYSLWNARELDSDPVLAPAPAPSTLLPEEIGSSIDRSATEASAPADGVRLLQLRSNVVDALLAGGGQSRRLSRMGLSDEEIEGVSAIKIERINELKEIEKAHAKVVSGEDGEYVAVAPFPNARQKWLEDIETDLRKMIDDDRASVIGRMIAFSDNDEDVGIYRREISIIETDSDRQKLRVEERTYNHDGQHIDSDYDLVGQQSRGRWGHLLELGDNDKN